MKAINRGYKRKCLECSVYFYDYGKEEIICPSCNHAYKPSDFLELSKLRTEIIKVNTKVGSAIASDDDSEDAVIEDTEELGDDGDIAIETEWKEPEE